MSITPHIRWMYRIDLPQVVAIEARSFEFPWGEHDFLNSLRRRNPNCIGMAAEHKGAVVAYMIYELHKHALDIIKLCVSPDLCGQTIGTQMIDKLKSKLSPKRRSRLYADVRETNLSALNFLKAMGFRAVRLIREAYEHTGEDVVRMEYRIKPQLHQPVNQIHNLMESNG